MYLELENRAVLTISVIAALAACNGDLPVEPRSTVATSAVQAISLSGANQCAPDEIPCGGLCSAIATDAHNCGQCGASCAGGEICHGGRCAIPAETAGGEIRRAAESLRSTLPSMRSRCAPGFANCGLGCSDLRTSRLHCGRCGHACAGPSVCVLGNCT